MKSSDRNPEMCRLFVLKAKEALSAHPNILHSWSIDEDEDHCILDIPKKSEGGFDIMIEVFPDHIDISADGPHHHMDYHQSIEETVISALALVRDMLSKGMRVIEHTRNGKPYKWQLQSFQKGKWISEETTGMLWFKFLGKKGSRVYQNDVLPNRL